jgi:hypothetical protein
MSPVSFAAEGRGRVLVNERVFIPNRARARSSCQRAGASPNDIASASPAEERQDFRLDSGNV